MDQISMLRVSKTNNNDEAIAFTQSIGSRMSAMEHLVPEQMFSTPQNQAQGISTVKALAIASQQGQKIWTINKDNVTLALNSINLGADTEMDIRNAVNAGKIVTTHEAKIDFNGWVGEGYIVIDPQTGAAAYMIAGGGNGAFSKLKNLLLKAQFMIGSMMSLNTSSFITKALFQSVGQIVSVILNAYNFLTKCSSLSNAIALTLVFTLISMAIMLMLFFFGWPRRVNSLNRTGCAGK